MTQIGFWEGHEDMDYGVLVDDWDVIICYATDWCFIYHVWICYLTA